MSEIAIFHHVYQFGDWEEIYTDQLLTLQSSGLFDAASYYFIGVNGEHKMPYNLTKVNKVFYNDKNTETEYCTIKALYDYCYLKENAKVLFLHTKGVTWSYSNENKNNIIKTYAGDFKKKEIYHNAQDWRKYLEHVLVEGWRTCTSLLDTYDIVGTEWVETAYIQEINYKIPHYAGGMWWATSDYIKLLNPNFITNNMIIGRYATELWVGTNNPNFYNFYTSNRNLYLFPIKSNEYENLI